jgi:ELWxxDGT repeat protein
MRRWIVTATVMLGACEPEPSPPPPDCDVIADCAVTTCSSDGPTLCAACDEGFTPTVGATACVADCDCQHGGACVAGGGCDCTGTDYEGATCDVPVCDPACENAGACVAPDTCDCEGTGFEGPVCDVPVCDPACENDGLCLTPDACDCTGTGFDGATCDVPVCETACENGGACVAPDVCDCTGTGYEGLSCESPVCATACENGGACVGPDTCDCDGTGYDGPTCDVPACVPACENGGVCVAPDTCDCDGTGHSGATCSVSPSKLVFAAHLDGEGQELWLSDGTVDGTYALVVNPAPDAPFDEPACLDAGNDALDCAFFLPFECELDPTSNPFCGVDGGSYPSRFTALGDHVYFVADDGTHGRELFRTDGASVERLTDVNPGGSSFHGGNGPEATELLFAHDGALYFSATDGTPLEGAYTFGVEPSGKYLVYRYTEATGVVPVPLADPDVELAIGGFTAYDVDLYFIAAQRDGANLDLFRFDGTNPATALGAPTTGRQGNSLRRPLAVEHGVYFAGYDGNFYRGYVYTADAPSPSFATLDFYERQTELYGATAFQGRVCGTTSPEGELVCYDGRPQPDGVARLGPTGLSNGFDTANVADERFCFVASTRSRAIYCTTGAAAAVALSGTEEASGLGSVGGDLWYVRSGFDLVRHAFDVGTPEVVYHAETPVLSAVVAAPGGRFLAVTTSGRSPGLGLYDLDAAAFHLVPDVTSAGPFFAWTP